MRSLCDGVVVVVFFLVKVHIYFFFLSCIDIYVV